MAKFKYQALLVSALLKDRGLYELEVNPLSDGLVLFFPGSSQVAYFYYVGDEVYRLKVWDKERGWETTTDYGSTCHLVSLLAEKHSARCKRWS